MDAVWYRADRESLPERQCSVARRRRCITGRERVRAGCVWAILVGVVTMPAMLDPARLSLSVSAQAPGGDVEGLSSDSRETSDPSDDAQVVRVGLNDLVTMHVSDMALADVLRMLSEPARRNIILADGAGGRVTASMYDVTFDAALAAILVSNGLGYRVDGEFVFVHPLEELAKMRQAKRRVSSRVFRLTYVNAAAAKDLIKPLLSSVGKVAVTPPSSVGLGGENGLLETEGDATATPDTLIVTDYEDHLVRIEQVLRELDAHPKQVLIEATVLRATLTEDNALGIDFTTVGGIDFAGLSSTSPGAQSITTGNTPVNMLGDTTLTVRTSFNAALPAGGFTFGIIKDQVSLFIQALEQISDTEILANPKILALNKQVGQVIVGRRDGYFTTTVTQTAAIQSVEFLETGTILTFRPFIGDDGYVRMEIHPKDSSGGVSDRGLPFETTTEVTTNVLVKDGHTILIGGLFREVSGATRGQVPGLGNIPIAGALFRRTRDNTVREEVIILLTVHILKDHADARAGEEMREEVERFRVGMRRSIQWLGRESFGQWYYRQAMEHTERGNTEKALWYTNLALHNSPRHLHAAKLKEELVGRRDWESDASAIRTYVQDRIAEESGIVAPQHGRPGPPFTIPEAIDGPSGFEETGAAGSASRQERGQ